MVFREVAAYSILQLFVTFLLGNTTFSQTYDNGISGLLGLNCDASIKYSTPMMLVPRVHDIAYQSLAKSFASDE